LWGYAAELLDYMSFFGSGGSLNYMRLKNGYETERIEFEGNDNPSPIEIDCGTAGVIQAGKWVMYTFIWNTDRTMDVYFNGELKGSSAAAADTTDGKKMLVTMFGRGYSTGAGFFGAMTEISHYTDVLTQAEINDLFNDGKAKSALEADGSGGLSAYWRNNGLFTWTDLTGDGNDGTITCDETILIPAGVDATRDNQGFIMNRQKDTSSLNLARDSYSAVLTANSMQDTFRGDFSVGFWMKTTNGRPSNNEYIMGTYNSSGEDYFYLQMRTNGTIRMTYKANNDGFDKYSDALIADTATGSWHYIVATVEKNASNGLKWYKDGDFSDQDDTTDVTDGNWEAWTSTDNLGIGALYYIGAFLAAYHFDGKIDNVVFYDDILTAAEVKRNYNAGKVSHRN
jgi:hypothetical protein